MEKKTEAVFLSDNGACYEWGPFGFDGVSRKGTTTLHEGDDLKKIGQAHTHQSYGSAWANLGNTPFRMYKHFTHEGGIRTPLIVHWPRGLVETNRWEHTPVHVMDIMPTLCAISQTTFPEKRDGVTLLPPSGVNLLPLWQQRDATTMRQRTLFFEHESARAVRHGNWKLVWGKRTTTPIKWELYDLTNDPCELDDLATQHPDRVKSMSDAWFIWAKDVGVRVH